MERGVLCSKVDEEIWLQITSSKKNNISPKTRRDNYGAKECSILLRCVSTRRLMKNTLSRHKCSEKIRKIFMSINCTTHI